MGSVESIRKLHLYFVCLGAFAVSFYTDFSSNSHVLCFPKVPVRDGLETFKWAEWHREAQRPARLVNQATSQQDGWKHSRKLLRNPGPNSRSWTPHCINHQPASPPDPSTVHFSREAGGASSLLKPSDNFLKLSQSGEFGKFQMQKESGTKTNPPPPTTNILIREF